MLADFNKKQKMEMGANKIAFQIAGTLFLIAVVVLVFANYKMYQKKNQLAAQINNYQEKIKNLKQSSQTLKNEIANADNIDYLEKIAYEQLGQQKPGEKEVIFIMPDKKADASLNTDNAWSFKSFGAWLSGTWQWIKSKF
jgi:cell division protein FtsB